MKLRPTLPPIPPDMQDLPVSQHGFPVPYFVKWVDGVPDFRISDLSAMYTCTQMRLCMICGKPLRGEGVFAMGPISALTRGNDEPPMHRACAEFSAQACPWMLMPAKSRNEAKTKPEGILSTNDLLDTPGAVYEGAPLIWCLYDTDCFGVQVQPNRTLMYLLGEPREIYWWKEGRRASRDEVIEGLELARQRVIQFYDSTLENEVVADEVGKMVEALNPWLPEAEA